MYKSDFQLIKIQSSGEGEMLREIDKKVKKSDNIELLEKMFNEIIKTKDALIEKLEKELVELRGKKKTNV